MDVAERRGARGAHDRVGTVRGRPGCVRRAALWALAEVRVRLHLDEAQVFAAEEEEARSRGLI